MKNTLLVHILSLLLLTISLASCSQTKDFRIRTITAGVNVSDLSDTTTLLKAIDFLKEARSTYIDDGYEVQTIRISTQHFYTYLGDKSYEEALPFLQKFDEIAGRNQMPFSIGNTFWLQMIIRSKKLRHGLIELINSTENINFSLPISSTELGILSNSIKAAAEVTIAVSKKKEGNFRFTASANCPPNIPFFPAAYHKGENSFGIGIEYPNALSNIFQ